MNIKSIKGTQDMLPADTSKWLYVENIARQLFALYNYSQINTPIIEEERLFSRSIGDTTDIVQKEMYAFKDRGDTKIALRPEGTASIVRAYIEHFMHKEEGLVKLFYLGPMFRGERPQAGRLRQFHHIGVEAIGSESPFLDAEVILLLSSILDKIGITGYEIRINSLGCPGDKEKLKKHLLSQLKDTVHLLCEDCQRRYEKNVFRLLDCKKEGCRKIISDVNLNIGHLCKSCNEHFVHVTTLLESFDTTFKIDPTLVRGLDYYTGTIFEVCHNMLGAQNALGAGGRYDGLVEALGGPKEPAIGFALGVERVLAVIEGQKINIPEPGHLDIFIVTIGEKAYKAGFKLLNSLRDMGICADIDYLGRSLKAQMRAANKARARYVAILGEDELNKGIVSVKDMLEGKQFEISIDGFVEGIHKITKGKQC